MVIAKVSFESEDGTTLGYATFRNLEDISLDTVVDKLALNAIPKYLGELDGSELSTLSKAVSAIKGNMVVAKGMAENTANMIGDVILSLDAEEVFNLVAHKKEDFKTNLLQSLFSQVAFEGEMFFNLLGKRDATLVPGNILPLVDKYVGEEYKNKAVELLSDKFNEFWVNLEDSDKKDMLFNPDVFEWLNHYNRYKCVSDLGLPSHLTAQDILKVGRNFGERFLTK